jgi:hypothetical protein
VKLRRDPESLSAQLAQHAVYKTCRTRLETALCQFDSIIDRRVVRDAVHVGHLIKAQPKQDPDFWIYRIPGS